MNTALILTGAEFAGLIASKGYDAPEPMRQLVDEMCAASGENDDIASSLQEKRLAQCESDELKVEPLLDLIIKEAAAAMSANKTATGAYAVECPNMCLLVSRYEWAEGMWRIAPFQDMPELLSSMT